MINNQIIHRLRRTLIRFVAIVVALDLFWRCSQGIESEDVVHNVVCGDLVRFSHRNDLKAFRHKPTSNNMALDCESDDYPYIASHLCLARPHEKSIAFRQISVLWYLSKRQKVCVPIYHLQEQNGPFRCADTAVLPGEVAASSHEVRDIGGRKLDYLIK